MAKRGRPSKKVMKKRKQMKKQSGMLLFVAFLLLIGIGAAAYFFVFKQGL